MSEKQTLVQCAQRALRGEGPWEPIMERINSFVRGDLDAEIAALTERLRAVEAERDADEKLIADLVTGMDSWAAQEDHEIYADAWPAYCNARARLVWEFADQKPSGTPPKVPKLSALRAELQRKDAALKEVLVGDSNISAWGRRIIDAALENLENTDGK